MSVKVTETYPKLKPYSFYGLSFKVQGLNAYATCPFCTREDKFSVKVEDGLWRCVVCNEGSDRTSASQQKYFKGGNVFTFLRLLWERSLEQTLEHEDLAESRGLLSASTLSIWGVRKSLVNGDWLLPGYGPDGKLMTLYKYAQTREGWKVLACPESTHQMYGVALYDKDKPTVYVCEGPWDAMALWEALRFTKSSGEDRLTLTTNENRSVLTSCNVIGLPACTVYNPKWSPLFAGKDVVILFDNDHPRTHPHTGQVVPPAAYEGMKRLASCLSSGAETKARTLSYLRWGELGYDLALPSGTDVRDVLKSSSSPAGRVREVRKLFSLIQPVPEDVFAGRTEQDVKEGKTTLTPEGCTSWAELIPAWRTAMRWSKGLNKALACMLASSASTMTQGDQVWLKVISSPSGGKSTLCEAMSVAQEFVIAKSTIRGFHSGYQSDKEGVEDNSLITQIKGKSLVTKDGDTLLTSPNLEQILAEGRDLYDTTARTHYRNKTARDYHGIRFTWILCGTSALRLIDHSELGQRFLDVVIMEDIDDDLEDAILDRKIHQTVRGSRYESNGHAETQNDPDMVEAMRRTAGYVCYLRRNVFELIKDVQVSQRHLESCKTFAKFVAYMRAKPSIKQNEGSGREMAARLVSQLGRLMMHLAVVLNKPSVDDEVMSIVKEVALDTARGRILQMCRLMYDAGKSGSDPRALGEAIHEAPEKTAVLLKFLVRIRAIEAYQHRPVPTLSGTVRYRLSERVHNLFKEMFSCQD